MSLEWKALRVFCATTTAILSLAVPSAEAQRPFTVADDIGLSYFGDPYLGKADPIVFSPDGRHFVVHTERGRLDLDRPESTLRIYKTEDVQTFLNHPGISLQPAPVWSFSKSSYKDGPVIQELRWFQNSSGFAFLAVSESGNSQLFLADLEQKRLRALTPEDQHVTGFDIHDADNLVYSMLSPSIRDKALADNNAISFVGTKHSLASLLSPAETLKRHDLSELWAVVDGRRFQIEDNSSHRPLALHWRGQQALALSPDGHSVLTALPIPVVPSSWETLYPPPYKEDELRIQGGSQDPQALDGWFYVSRYVLIDLRNSDIKPLQLGPLSYEAGWPAFPRAGWSADGKSIALANTFLERDAADSSRTPARPCQVVFDLVKGSAVCLEQLTGQTKDGLLEDGYHLVEKIYFDSKSNDRVTLDYVLSGGNHGSSSYTRSTDGLWTLDVSATGSVPSEVPIEVSVKQSLNDPPVLVATDRVTKLSRVILDPNPWLKDINLGEASVYKWTDEAGRELLGGLYKPPQYVAGRQYPLVIQTHGFSENEFVPSGIYPTGFAARELAASGFMVLQVRDCRIRHTLEEGPCQVSGYEAAVKQLASDGLVDSRNVGIVGFSRSCYYVLEALTKSTLHLKAASITDGVDMGYLQYILADKIYTGDAHSVMGAPPFGEGLQQWLKRSPEFNMDKVTAPLLVVAVGRAGIVFEWEPYSTLWHLDKPVDLIALREGTHPLTNPGQRLISQSSTVDWMRFWLKGEEDPDPAKREQYNRWRELRDLQRRDNRKESPVPAN